MRRLVVLVAFVLVAMAVGSPQSSAATDHDICFSIGTESYKDKANYPIGEAACTRMINSGSYKGKALASIYRARGSWRQKQGNLEPSLADYGISIRMEPDNVEGYDYRADVYQQQGDFDRALTDYDHATRISPTYAAAYYSRGLIYEKKGDIAKARLEYNSAIAVPTINRIAKWAQDNARARLKALDEPKKE